MADALGQQNMRRLLGEAVTAETQCEIGRVIVESPGIDSLMEPVTMRRSPDEVLVAARVAFDDEASVAEQRVREVPEVRHVFLDPTDDPLED